MIDVIACIGGGNMGQALMTGAAKSAGPSRIGFTDIEPAKAEAAARTVGGRVFPSNIEAARQGDGIFLAVKPQVLAAVLKEIAPVARERLAASRNTLPVVVSMAAGWSIRAIQEALQGPLPSPPPVFRIMPNTPALIGRGLIAAAASPEVAPEAAADLERILAGSGIVDRVPESLMDGVTALSGSGPAFVYLFIEALADGGVQCGLPRDKALLYAAQTVLGGAAMARETGKHPGELKDMVTSPGGTTIAGVAALERGAFRGTVMAAVEAAFKRIGALAGSA